MDRDEWASLQSMTIASVKDWAAEADRHDADGLPEIAHECRMRAAALMMSTANNPLTKVGCAVDRELDAPEMEGPPTGITS